MKGGPAQIRVVRVVTRGTRKPGQRLRPGGREEREGHALGGGTFNGDRSSLTHNHTNNILMV